MIVNLDKFKYTTEVFHVVGSVRLYVNLEDESPSASESTYLPLSTYGDGLCPYCGSDVQHGIRNEILTCEVDGYGGWEWEGYECGVVAATRVTGHEDALYILGISERTNRCMAATYIEDDIDSKDDVV